MKENVKQLAVALAVITLGAAIYALGFVWCYQPNEIASGGLTGLAQIVNRLIPAVPVGVAVIVMNTPLFVLALKLIGGRLILYSLYAMFISSVFIDLLTTFFTWEPMDPFLACIFGGLAMGLSLGVVFSQGATTGGTDLIARLLKLKLNWLPMGRLLLVIDLVVILLTALVFGSYLTALYGLVALFISSMVIDKVLYGMDVAKVAFIITQKPKEVNHALVYDLDRGVTILKGIGGYSGEEREVLMCAFKQREIVAIKKLVKDLDPAAFIIVADAHEVTGEGFREYKHNDL